VNIDEATDATLAEALDISCKEFSLSSQIQFD